MSYNYIIQYNKTVWMVLVNYHHLVVVSHITANFFLIFWDNICIYWITRYTDNSLPIHAILFQLICFWQKASIHSDTELLTWPYILQQTQENLQQTLVKVTLKYNAVCFSACPKWSKLSKKHKEKKSILLLVVCSSAHRTLELIK